MLQKPGNTVRSWLSPLGVVACLLPFLLGQVQQLVFHPLVHGHEYAEQHSAVEEADACHRSVFHEGVTNGCDHPTHLTHQEQDCEWCDFLLIPCLFSLKKIAASAPQQPGDAVYYYASLDGRPGILSAFARGPPL